MFNDSGFSFTFFDVFNELKIELKRQRTFWLDIKTVTLKAVSTLSFCLSFFLSFFLSFLLSVSHALSLSICLSVCLSVHPSVRPFVRLSVRLSICLSVCISVPFSLSVCIYQTLPFFLFFTCQTLSCYLRHLCVCTTSSLLVCLFYLDLPV